MLPHDKWTRRLYESVEITERVYIRKPYSTDKKQISLRRRAWKRWIERTTPLERPKYVISLGTNEENARLEQRASDSFSPCDNIRGVLDDDFRFACD